MTEEMKAKIEAKAMEYSTSPLPETLKEELITYKTDNLKIIQAMEKAAFRKGARFGYALGLEASKGLLDALEQYENEKCWVDETTRDRNGMAYTHSIYKMRQIAIQAIAEFKEKVRE